jgi:hypothetical protein
MDRKARLALGHPLLEIAVVALELDAADLGGANPPLVLQAPAGGPEVQPKGAWPCHVDHGNGRRRQGPEVCRYAVLGFR